MHHEVIINALSITGMIHIIALIASIERFGDFTVLWGHPNLEDGECKIDGKEDYPESD